MIDGEMRFTVDATLDQDSVHGFFISLDDGGVYCPLYFCAFENPFRLSTYTEGSRHSFNTFQELLRYVVSETTERRSKENETSPDHS